MKRELTEEEKKEIDHMTECMRKITLPDLPEKNRKDNRKQGRLL